MGGMRLTLGIAVKAALGQVAIVTGAFFAEAVFPLGDYRWLVICVVSILALGVWVYFERKWEKRRTKSQKLQCQLDQFLEVYKDTRTKINHAQIIQALKDLGEKRGTS